MENKEKIFNISNGLSFLRLLMAFPMFLLITEGHNYAAIALAVIAFITDISDGYLARRLGQVTDAGKIIDPFADKVFVAGAFIALIIAGYFPPWFAVLVIGRDVLIISAGIFLRNRVKVIPMSNYIGKAAVLMISQSIIIAMLELKALLAYSMMLAILGVAVSLASYSVNLFKMLKNTDAES